MTQEEKHLLLIDLCARLPYSVRIRHYVNDIDFYSNPLMTYDINQLEGNKAIIKPYLRPLSRMTEEEVNEFHKLRFIHVNYSSKPLQCVLSVNEIDWLNAHYFDYRGLIEMELALEAPEGMYNIK